MFKYIVLNPHFIQQQKWNKLKFSYTFEAFSIKSKYCFCMKCSEITLSLRLQHRHFVYCVLFGEFHQIKFITLHVQLKSRTFGAYCRRKIFAIFLLCHVAPKFIPIYKTSAREWSGIHFNYKSISLDKFTIYINGVLKSKLWLYCLLFRLMYIFTIKYRLNFAKSQI